ncbi:unnamed protein product [Periconia digitata]|uniref:AA9 family lytic polysaccharide monooxygenase n=1 Tax=Periconia digitata TaxID=1303443 RepID=A0A9W4UES0_9PLEO|nr:unnamed protein product [Periconia digitata]
MLCPTLGGVRAELDAASLISLHLSCGVGIKGSSCFGRFPASWSGESSARRSIEDGTTLVGCVGTQYKGNQLLDFLRITQASGSQSFIFKTTSHSFSSFHSLIDLVFSKSNMKLTSSVLAAAALTNSVSAHYFFDKLVVDGVETKAGQYVRANTRKESYMPTKWKNPIDNITPDDTDFRCNKGAFTNAGKTQTMEVKAGSKLGMKLGVGATMQHPGPQLVYMSKAPTTAQAYEGDGDWFKIFESGVCDEKKDFTKQAWCSWDKDSIEFTIPKDTPDGEYLVRSEHIALHGAHDGQAEFYYECAQVKVVGGGNGTPGPMVKIPGVYQKNDPEVNFSLWSGYKPYTMPGPSVWSGGSTGGAAGNATAEDVPSATAPVAGTPSASAAPVASAAAHTDKDCGGKLARTRRAFREMFLLNKD